MGFSYQAWLPLGLRVLLNPVPTSWTGGREGVQRGSRSALEEPHIHSEAQGDSGFFLSAGQLGLGASTSLQDPLAHTVGKPAWVKLKSNWFQLPEARGGACTS